MFDSPFWETTLFDGSFFEQELAVGQFSRYEKLTLDLRGVTRAGFTYLLARDCFDRRDRFHPFCSGPEIRAGVHPWMEINNRSNEFQSTDKRIKGYFTHEREDKIFSRE